MKSILKPTIILTIIGLICTLSLSHVQKLTAPIIVKRTKEKQEQALSLVMPGFTTIGAAVTVTIDGAEFVYWEGEKKVDDKTNLKGYAFLTKSPGYSGDIESIVGIDEKGSILGISIINQSETPGLGAKCAEVENRQTLWDYLKGNISARDMQNANKVPWFQNQFKGLNAFEKMRVLKLGEWSPALTEKLRAENAISALTGASITSNAVVRSIEHGMELLKKAQDIAAARKGEPK